MKVRATQLGFYNGSRKRPGDVFDIPDGAKIGSWFVPADSPAPESQAPDNVEPIALSQLSKKMAKKGTVSLEGDIQSEV
jgi:hypothetical protein